MRAINILEKIYPCTLIFQRWDEETISNNNNDQSSLTDETKNHHHMIKIRKKSIHYPLSTIVCDIICLMIFVTFFYMQRRSHKILHLFHLKLHNWNNWFFFFESDSMEPTLQMNSTYAHSILNHQTWNKTKSKKWNLSQ